MPAALPASPTITPSLPPLASSPTLYLMKCGLEVPELIMLLSHKTALQPLCLSCLKILDATGSQTGLIIPSVGTAAAGAERGDIK
jgi:hypothetical protein